jgi:ComF family protein
MQAALSLAVELAGAALAPPRCSACDEPVSLLRAFCPACASTVLPSSEYGNERRAAFVYEGAIARAITRFKYEGRPDLARPLGDLLWRALEPRRASLSGVVVVPVPLHPARLAVRGFNQSALLARRISRRLRVPFWPLALKRLRDTPRQTTLDRPSRLANVEHGFVVRRPAGVQERRVLLIDDVRTTGATLEACERALHAAGAAEVSWAVVAQAAETSPKG